MGRPRTGEEYIRKHISFTRRLIEDAEALRRVSSTIGRPSFTEFVRSAVERMVQSELQKPEIKAAVDRLRRKQDKVVELRDVKKKE